MHAQGEKLRKTGRNLKKIEKSVIPGLDSLLGAIKRVELRNRIVIAFVMGVCLAILIYGWLIKPMMIGGAAV